MCSVVILHLEDHRAAKHTAELIAMHQSNQSSECNNTVAESFSELCIMIKYTPKLYCDSLQLIFDRGIPHEAAATMHYKLCLTSCTLLQCFWSSCMLLNCFRSSFMPHCQYRDGYRVYYSTKQCTSHLHELSWPSECTTVLSGCHSRCCTAALRWVLLLSSATLL
jgi:hypothetical protein